MNILFSLLILIGMGLFAFITFILAQHKEEIWDSFEFEK